MTEYRIRGVLMGQLVGDALGARYEFRRAVEVEQAIKRDMKHGRGGILPMLGEGAFRLKEGEITDDGEMALTLSSCLLVDAGYKRATVATAYVRWQKTKPQFIGRTTLNALRIEETVPKDWMNTWSFEQKQKVLEAVLENVRQKNESSLSNGFLMRIAPLPAFYYNQPFESWSQFVIEEVGLTHLHPATFDAALIYTQAIHQLINKSSPQAVYQNALLSANHPVVKQHLELAASQRTPIPYGDEMELSTNGDDKIMGYFGIALQVAFYELLHAKSFAEGLVNVILVGGDADTNGCITAALLGAHFGEKEIPLEWRKAVRAAELRLHHENGITSVTEVVNAFVQNGVGNFEKTINSFRSFFANKIKF